MRFHYGHPNFRPESQARFVWNTAPGNTVEYDGDGYGLDSVDIEFYLENRSADETFHIKDSERNQYHAHPDLLQQYDAIKGEQESLTTELRDLVDLQADIRARNQEYFGARSELGRTRSLFRQHKVTHTENIDRLSGQLVEPTVLPSFIETAAQYDPPPNNQEIAQFLIDNGVQAGPALSRMVQAVQNLLTTQREVVVQEAEIAVAQEELDTLRPEIDALAVQFTESQTRMSEVSNRLSEIFYNDLPEIERQKATIDIQLMLTELQGNLDQDGDGVIDQLSPAEQVERLVTLSQLETTTDAVAQEERNWREYLRDGVGFALESTVFNEAMANWARQRVDQDPKVQILRNMSPEAVRMFVQHYPHQAMLLTTDMVDPDSFRIDFLGNEVLEGEIDLVDFFPTQPQFIEYQGQLAYLSTIPNGQLVYRNAETDAVIVPETNYVFTILNDTPEMHPDIAPRLATEAEMDTYWQAETLRGVNDTLTVTILGMMSEAYEVNGLEEFEAKFTEQYGQFNFGGCALDSYGRFRAEIERIQNDEDINVLEAQQQIITLQEAFQTELLGLFTAGFEEINNSDLPAEEKTALIDQLNILQQVTSPESRQATLDLTYDRIEIRRGKIIENIISTYYRESNPAQIADIRRDLVALSNGRFDEIPGLEGIENPSRLIVTRLFLRHNPASTSGSDLQAELIRLYSINATEGSLQIVEGTLDAASIQTDTVFSENIRAFWSAPGLSEYQRQIQAALTNVDGDPPPSAEVLGWLEAINTVEFSPVGSPEERRSWAADKEELTRCLQALYEASLRAEEGEANVARAEENRIMTDIIYERSLTPAFETVRETARANPALLYDPNVLGVLSSPETDMSTLDAEAMIRLVESDVYRNATPENQAIMMAQTTSQPLSLNADAETLQSQYGIVLPAGVRFGTFQVSPSGEVTGSFESDETQFLVETDGTIIAEHLTGVPDAEDLRVPPQEWATAQALAAMQDSFVAKSAAELAQSAETLGNVALVNFMRQYWGIRGNDTLPESELDNFKSLGEMMSNNRINFHTVLHQLNATKWDETAAGNRALDVRLQFNEVLAAAAAGNNDRFRELLNLDSLPEDDLVV